MVEATDEVADDGGAVADLAGAVTADLAPPTLISPNPVELGVDTEARARPAPPGAAAWSARWHAGRKVDRAVIWKNSWSASQ